MLDPDYASAAASLLVGFAGTLASLLIVLRQQRHKIEEIRVQMKEQLILLTRTRSLDAVEKWWQASVALQSGEQLSDEKEEELLRAALWLPEEIRSKAISVLREPHATGTSGTSGASQLRSDITDFIKSATKGV